MYLMETSMYHGERSVANDCYRKREEHIWDSHGNATKKDGLVFATVTGTVTNFAPAGRLVVRPFTRRAWADYRRQSPL